MNWAGLWFVKSQFVPIPNKLAMNLKLAHQFLLPLWHGGGLGRYLNMLLYRGCVMQNHHVAR